MLAYAVFALLLCIVKAAPSLDLAGPATPERMYSLAQRHARSSLEKRNECWHDEDCPPVLNAFQSTCSAQRCCDVHCKSGYSLVWGQCHKNQPSNPSKPADPSNGGCPAGKRLYMGVCVAAPSSALSPKRQCNKDNDCTTGRGHAYATCQNGQCSIVCWPGYKYNAAKKYCNRDTGYDCSKSGCPNGPDGSHLIGVCRADGRCTAVCESGYQLGGILGGNGPNKYRCYKTSPDTCAATTCAKIIGGKSSCANGKCSYICDDLKKIPILRYGTYRCENVNTNPQCCGEACIKCPLPPASSYQGSGVLTRTCNSGTCGFFCKGGGSLGTDPSGKPFCK